MLWKRNNPKDDTLKPGMVFEKYTVIKQLGRGGMGSVYLVRHNMLDTLFALKILASDVAAKDKQFVDRFIREAKLACKIKHQNLIAVHDAGKNQKTGMYYIVMDYVSGGCVRDLLKKTPRVPPARALEIVTQVADALTAAYAHRMVHRDIKPDNIMFAADGSAKLADLGIAKSTDEQDTMLTMAASVFGTPAYMSPEQARDSSKVDSRADIYSLGIVFFEMLSGQRPFAGGTAIQILSQVMDSAGIPDIRRICPETPPDLAALISRMTEKDLEKRIPNPDILLQELKKIRIPAQIGAQPLRVRDGFTAEKTGNAPMRTPDKTSSTLSDGATNPTLTKPSDGATNPTLTKPSDAATTPPLEDAVPSAESVARPDVTLATQSDAPAVPDAGAVVRPDVTLATLPDAPSVPDAGAVRPDVTLATLPDAPSVPDAGAVRPDVTLATLPDAPSVPDAGAVRPDVTLATLPDAPSVPDAGAVRPDVTLATLPDAPPATVSVVPNAIPETAIPETAIPETAIPETAIPDDNRPDVTVPTLASAVPAASPEKNAPPLHVQSVPSDSVAMLPGKHVSRIAPSQKDSKSRRGVLIASVAAMSIVVLAACAVFFMKRFEDTEQIQPQPPGTSRTSSSNPSASGQVDGDARNTPAAGQDVVRGGAEPHVPVGGQGGGRTGAAPHASVGDDTPGPDVVVDDFAPPREDVSDGSDALGSNQIVLLADMSETAGKVKALLTKAFPREKISFQEAEGLGSYKPLLAEIIESEPAMVVICFVQQYAEDGTSVNGYKGAIEYHVMQLHDNGVPFVFVQPPENKKDRTLQALFDATVEVCRENSVSLIHADDLDGKLVPLVREEAKKEK